MSATSLKISKVPCPRATNGNRVFFTRTKSKIVVALLSENFCLFEKATFVVEACDNSRRHSSLLYPNYSVKAILKAFCVRIKQIK